MKSKISRNRHIVRPALAMASAALVAALLFVAATAAADDHPRTNRIAAAAAGVDVDGDGRRVLKSKSESGFSSRDNVFDRSKEDAEKLDRKKKKKRGKDKKEKKGKKNTTKKKDSAASSADTTGLDGREGQCQTMTIYRRKEDLVEGETYLGDLTDGQPGDAVIITIPFYGSEDGGDAMGEIVQDWTWNIGGDGIGDMIFNFDDGGQVFTSFTLDCAAGGSTNPITGGTGPHAGIEGYVKFASTRIDEYKNQLTLHYDCPGWGENDRRLLERRMQHGCWDDLAFVESLYLAVLGPDGLIPVGLGCLYDETCTSGECGLKELSYYDWSFGPIQTGYCVCSNDNHCPTGEICGAYLCWSINLELGEACDTWYLPYFLEDNVKYYVAENGRCSSNNCRYSVELKYSPDWTAGSTCMCNRNSCPDDSPSCDSAGACYSAYLEVCNPKGDYSTSCEDGYRCSKRVGEADLQCRKEDGVSCTKNQQCSSRCCKNNVCKTEDECHKSDFQFSHECTDTDDCGDYAKGLLCKQSEGKCKRPNGWKCTADGQCASHCCKLVFGNTSKTCRPSNKCSN